MVQKKKSSRRTAKKRKPKVNLDNKKVTFLTAFIIVLCFLFLLMNTIFSAQTSDAAKEKTAAAKKTEIVPEKKSSKKNDAQNKSSIAIKKNEELKKSVENKIPEVKKESPKQEKNVQKKTETKPLQNQQKKEETKIASIPNKKTEEKKLPEKYKIPPAVNGAKLCFVIDDAGMNVSNLKRYTSLPFDLTIAVLPKLANSKPCAYVVRSSGKELILHQPMQSGNLNLNPGPGAINPEMTMGEIYALVSENLSEIGPNVKGLNNHEGSLITSDEMKIGSVLDVAFDSGIYFLDSRTTAETKAPAAALERDMKIKERDVFIDDIVGRDEMLFQIYRGLEIANKKGKAIMIGHVDKSVEILPALLNDMYPYLKKAGYEITTPSKLN